MRTVLTVLSALVASTAHAQMPTFFGIQLGQALDVPQCAHEPRPFDGKPTYKVGRPKDGPCYRAASVQTDGPQPDGLVTIYWPSGQWPEHSTTGSIDVWSVDGEVHTISMTTAGLATQDDVLSALTQKLGRPKAMKRVPVQNRMGAKYTSIEAMWVSRGVTVEFNGLSGSIDYGGVLIQTSKGVDYHREREEQRPKGPRM
jgi:hypothetical protein